MKVYDKEIYEKQESIKYTLLIIIVFLVGFFAELSQAHAEQELQMYQPHSLQRRQ